MWNYFKKRNLKIQAENAAFEKYRESLTDIHARFKRLNDTKSEADEISFQRSFKAREAAFDTAMAEVVSGFGVQIKVMQDNHARIVSVLQKEMSDLKAAHKAQLDLNASELQSKMQELSRKQSKLEDVIQKYEAACKDTVEQSGRLKALIAEMEQKTVNDQLELQKTKASVKDTANTLEQIQTVSLPKIAKTLESGVRAQ